MPLAAFFFGCGNKHKGDKQQLDGHIFVPCHLLLVAFFFVLGNGLFLPDYFLFCP